MLLSGSTSTSCRRRVGARGGRAKRVFADRLKPELMQCVLESGTGRLRGHRSGGGGPARHPPLRRGVRARAGLRLGAAATHPFSLFENQKITPVTATGCWSRCCSTSPAASWCSACTCTSPCPTPSCAAGHGGRADRAAGAARALVQLAVLARRGHGPGVDPGADLRALPAQRPAAAVRHLRRLRRGGRLHGGDRRDRRLHAPVVGRPAAPPPRHDRAAGDGRADQDRGHRCPGSLRAVPGQAAARPDRGRQPAAPPTAGCCSPRTSGWPRATGWTRR